MSRQEQIEKIRDIMCPFITDIEGYIYDFDGLAKELVRQGIGDKDRFEIDGISPNAMAITEIKYDEEDR